MTSPTAAAESGELALATRGLRKAHGKPLAVAGLDLSVPRGILYGFLGPNGAGKTTTMPMLTGLIEPDAGDITSWARSSSEPAGSSRRGPRGLRACA